MFKGISIGGLLFFLIVIVTRDLKLITKYSVVLTGVCWLLAATFSGALVSGDRNRANFSSEDRMESITRQKRSYICFFAGIPAAFFLIASYIVSKNI